MLTGRESGESCLLTMDEMVGAPLQVDLDWLSLDTIRLVSRISLEYGNAPADSRGRRNA